MTKIENFTLEPTKTLPLSTRKKASLYKIIIERFISSSEDISKITIDGKTLKNTAQGLRHFLSDYTEVYVLERNKNIYLVRNLQQ